MRASKQNDPGKKRKDFRGGVVRAQNHPGRATVTRYFEWNKLMVKARNPKPEIRPALRSTPTEIAVRSSATAEGERINVGQASRLSVVPRPKGSGTTLSHAPAEIGQ